MEGRGGEGQEPAAADGDWDGSRQHPDMRQIRVGDLVDQLEAVGRLVEEREEGVADVVVVDVEGVARAVDVVQARDVVSGRAQVGVAEVNLVAVHLAAVRLAIPVSGVVVEGLPAECEGVVVRRGIAEGDVGEDRLPTVVPDAVAFAGEGGGEVRAVARKGDVRARVGVGDVFVGRDGRGAGLFAVVAGAGVVGAVAQADPFGEYMASAEVAVQSVDALEAIVGDGTTGDGTRVVPPAVGVEVFRSRAPSAEGVFGCDALEVVTEGAVLIAAAGEGADGAVVKRFVGRHPCVVVDAEAVAVGQGVIEVQVEVMSGGGVRAVVGVVADFGRVAADGVPHVHVCPTDLVPGA